MWVVGLLMLHWMVQLGVMLNSLKRLLDTLRPRMEAQMKAWVACLPEEGGGPGRVVFGERLNEVTIELRAKYKNYLQSIVEKLADNVSPNTIHLHCVNYSISLNPEPHPILCRQSCRGQQS
jgi:hypothetical protein